MSFSGILSYFEDIVRSRPDLVEENNENTDRKKKQKKMPMNKKIKQLDKSLTKEDLCYSL